MTPRRKEEETRAKRHSRYASAEGETDMANRNAVLEYLASSANVPYTDDFQHEVKRNSRGGGDGYS